MNIYQDLSRKSGIAGYKTGPDYITVYFDSGMVYTYSYASARAYHVGRMKVLADQGFGLNSYINKNTKYAYAHKHRRAS